MNEIAELWAVSVTGPDDLIPVADYLTAVRLSNTFNEWWASRIKQQGLHEFAPRMWATPVVYNGDTKQHTASIENPSKDYEPFIALLSERHSHESSPAPKEEAGWRPIETAPRDGTEILAWFPRLKLDEDGNLTNELVDEEPFGGRAIIDWCGGWREPDWLNASGDWFGDDFEYAPDPTLWTPLPTPPSASNDGKEK